MLSKFKKILFGFVFFVVMIILLLSVLVMTQGGSRWVALRAAHLAHINLNHIQGNLLTGMDIGSIDYQQDGLMVHAEKLAFRWQPLALFYTSISMQSLTAEKIRVRLPPAKKPPQNAPDLYDWPSLAQPLRVELGNLQLRDIQIEQDNSTLLLNNISGSVSLGTFHLRVKDFVVDNSQFTTATTGTMGLRYPYALALKSQWQYVRDNEPITPASGTVNVNSIGNINSTLTLAGSVNVSGNIKKIVLKQSLKQPFIVNTTASIAPALQDKKRKPYADIQNEWPQQKVPHELIEKFIDKEKYPFLARLLTTQGHLQLQGWLDEYHLKGLATATTSEAELTAEINVNGSQTRVPLAKNSHMKWHLEKFHINSQAIGGSAQERSFLQLTGDLSWSPAIEWDFVLQGEHINAAHLFSEWPSDLQVNIASKGAFKNQKNFSAPNWRVAINQLNVQGELRGLNLSSDGAMDFDGSHWKSSDINIALGANQISFKGKAGKDLALEWKINAPLLNQIDPSIRGSIISSGFLSGDLEKPSVQANANINKLLWRDYAVDKLAITLKPRENNHYNLTFEAEHLQLQEHRIAQLSIQADGNMAQHKITAAVQSPTYGVLNFLLDSSWQDNLWRGQWRSFSIDIKKIPRWYLSSSEPMQADKNHINFGNICLTSATQVGRESQSLLNTDHLPHSNSEANKLKLLAEQSAQKSDVIVQEVPRICVSGEWKGNAGYSANVHAVAVPLRQAQAWFKPEVTLLGVVDAQLSLQASATHALTADWQLQARNSQFIYQFQGGNTEAYPLKQASFTGSLKNNLANASLVLDWGQYGILNAEGKYALADKNVQALITASLTDLAPLESLVPALNNVQGVANANINVSGNITKPDITGALTLAKGSANFPKLGLELKDISLEIASQAAGLIHLQGEFLSGDGQLKLKGNLTNLGAENWHCQGNIFGANIRIIQQSELSATVSPNLTFTADAGAINVNGTTEIPWARAAIKTLPASATRVSNDVIISDADNYLSPRGKSRSGIPFYTNVLLYFGDDVRFKGFGLDGQLSGKINVFKEENRQTFTTGFVAVNNGIYKAYGQELSIARGRLLFQGPYDNPGLDIRALRNIETARAGEPIIAGLEVGGTLQNPRSTVFSIPTMDDSNAMALLLTGKVKDQLSVGDAYTLITAVSSMGVEKGSMITADIASFFRLDEITIKSEKGLEQSQLWMGKYITPKLFLRYVVGLFDQAFTLGLRYQLNDKLRLEAESGKVQSLDVIYKIER